MRDSIDDSVEIQVDLQRIFSLHKAMVRANLFDSRNNCSIVEWMQVHHVHTEDSRSVHPLSAQNSLIRQLSNASCISCTLHTQYDTIVHIRRRVANLLPTALHKHNKYHPPHPPCHRRRHC